MFYGAILFAIFLFYNNVLPECKAAKQVPAMQRLSNSNWLL